MRKEHRSKPVVPHCEKHNFCASYTAAFADGTTVTVETGPFPSAYTAHILAFDDLNKCLKGLGKDLAQSEYVTSHSHSLI